MMGEGFGMGFGGGYMWFFWILLIIVILWVVKSVTERGNKSPGKDKSALEILKERYAKGEIDQSEYEQKRKDLNG
jgi:putative membrane protein